MPSRGRRLTSTLTVVGMAPTGRDGWSIVQLGSADCERVAGRVLAQPVNAVSSLAYVAAALAITIVGRRTQGNTMAGLVFAVCLAGIGIGSFAFHGPQPAGSQLMHDLPILFILLWMILHTIGLLRPHFPWLPAFATGAAAAGLTAGFLPGTTAILTAAFVIGLAVTEVISYRRVRTLEPRSPHRFRVATYAVFATAGGLWLLGRSDSPVCDPDSIVQPHGLWHMATAVGFAMWWWLRIAEANGDRSVEERSLGSERSVP